MGRVVDGGVRTLHCRGGSHWFRFFYYQSVYCRPCRTSWNTYRLGNKAQLRYVGFEDSGSRNSTRFLGLAGPGNVVDGLRKATEGQSGSCRPQQLDMVVRPASCSPHAAAVAVVAVAVAAAVVVVVVVVAVAVVEDGGVKAPVLGMTVVVDDAAWR